MVQGVKHFLLNHLVLVTQILPIKNSLKRNPLSLHEGGPLQLTSTELDTVEKSNFPVIHVVFFICPFPYFLRLENFKLASISHLISLWARKRVQKIFTLGSMVPNYHWASCVIKLLSHKNSNYYHAILHEFTDKGTFYNVFYQIKNVLKGSFPRLLSSASLFTLL